MLALLHNMSSEVKVVLVVKRVFVKCVNISSPIYLGSPKRTSYTHQLALLQINSNAPRKLQQLQHENNFSKFKNVCYLY